MYRKILAMLLSMALLFCCSFSPAEEMFSDDEEFFDEEIEDMTEEDFAKQKRELAAKAGYTMENYKEEGDFTYEVSDDELFCRTVRYNKPEDEGIVTVPETLGGYPVAAIGDHTFMGCMISGVVLPEGITELGEQAFFQCMNLQEIIIPEGVEILQKCCFGACTQLFSVMLPSTLLEVGEMAFLGCASLQEIVFPESLETIGLNAFNTCATLRRAVLPSEDVEVDPTAFANCPALTIEYLQ